MGWLQEVAVDGKRIGEDAAVAIAAQIDTMPINAAGQDGTSVVVFNTTPHAQKALVVFNTAIDSLALDSPIIVNNRGEDLPTDARIADNGSNTIQFVADMAGLGYTTFWMRQEEQSEGDPAASGELTKPLTFQNEQYAATVDLDGTFTSLRLLASDAELLDIGSVRGNQLAAMDSTGLSPWRPAMAPREDWQPPRPGPQLHWTPTAPPQVRHSPLGATLTTTGQMSELVQANLTVNFYHQLPAHRSNLGFHLRYGHNRHLLR